MSLARSELLYTEAEYLALERESEERHEYLDGQIYQMAGESEEHGFICVNLTRIVSTCLRGNSCVVFSKDMKVRSGPDPIAPRAVKGLFSYPDLVIVCGGRQYHDEYRDVLLNPRIIIEVLSPTTEAFDRGEKFLRYRTYLESLTNYVVVVAQSRPLIEHFTREPDGKWLIAVAATELSESVALSSIGCVLRLSEVYERIAFPTHADEEPDHLDS